MDRNYVYTFSVTWSDDKDPENFTVEALDDPAAWSLMCDRMFKAGWADGMAEVPVSLKAVLISRRR